MRVGCRWIPSQTPGQITRRHEQLYLCDACGCGSKEATTRGLHAVSPAAENVPSRHTTSIPSSYLGGACRLAGCMSSGGAHSDSAVAARTTAAVVDGRHALYCGAKCYNPKFDRLTRTQKGAGQCPICRGGGGGRTNVNTCGWGNDRHFISWRVAIATFPHHPSIE